MARLSSHYTTIVSSDYPSSLKQINCPPFVLFYHGKLSVLDHHCIGVIGMRKPSEYGIYATNKLVKDLADLDYTIVSGMALGIDGIAHRCALHNKAKSVAVLGGGIDYIYPKGNSDIYNIMKSDHLVISEYPYDLMPSKDGFPKRNRIIAGLSERLLVTEANEKSGTMITVGFALEQGKDIFAVPGRIDDAPGCNLLIQQGAKLIRSVDDILEEVY